MVERKAGKKGLFTLERRAQEAPRAAGIHKMLTASFRKFTVKKFMLAYFSVNSGLGEFSRKVIPLWRDALLLVEGRCIFSSR